MMQVRLMWLLLLLMSQSVFAANQCYEKGNEVFSVQFEVVGHSNHHPEVYITNNGGRRTETLWYTGTEKSDNKVPYLFNEQSLQDGVKYQIRIINDSVNDVLQYYRRVDSEVNSDWVLVQEIGQKIHQGVIHILSNDPEITMICAQEIVEPEEPVLFNQCDYFPQPIQSWIAANNSDYNNFPSSELDLQIENVNIRGWSDGYLDDPDNFYHFEDWTGDRTVLRVGYERVSNSWLAYENPNAKVCNGNTGCYPGNEDGQLHLRQTEAPVPIAVEFTAQEELTISNDPLGNDRNSYTRVCADSKSSCQYSEEGDTVTITIVRDLKLLHVDTNSSKKFKLEFFGNRKIENFEYMSKPGFLEVIFERFATHYFSRIIGDGDQARFHFASHVRLNITDSFTPNNTLIFNYPPDTGVLSDFVAPVIYGPHATFTFIQLQSDTTANAEVFLLARHIKFTKFVQLSGSITANKLTVQEGLNLNALDGSPDCWKGGESQDSYDLTLSPTESYSLICEREQVEFQVLDDTNQATGTFNGTIDVEAVGGTLNLIKGSGSNGSYRADENGQLWFELSETGSEIITVSGTLMSNGNSSQAAGTYHFVPYKLAADDQFVIANKEQSVQVKALACDDSGNVVDTKYSGSPDVSSAWVAPTDGAGRLDFKPVFPEESKGESISPLTMQDSGIKTVTMTDTNFDCTGFSDCPIKGKGTLQGSFTVYSRPWTLAICSPNDSSSMDGNITARSSTAFTAAGSNFALNVRPLRWISNGAEQGEIETSGLCAEAVTQNFFADAAQLTAMTELSYQVAQPEEGDSGTLNGILALSNDAGENNSYLPFSDLSWSEVGVLRVQAAISGQYLGMTVNPGYRDIGRFYPAWLSLSANDWDYPDDHSGFAYMNQPFGYGFSVAAQNRQGQITKNYSSFDAALIADIKLLAVDSSGAELGARISDYDLQFWDGSGSWSDGVLSGDHSLTFSKLVSNSSPYTTSADGPFNSGFGLRVTDKVDGVDFAAPQLALTQDGASVDNGQVFALQPDIRYGRMVLDDVGGAVTSVINVPLRVEYWQGSRFVTNRDDNGSWFRSSSNSICRQSIWTSDAGKFNSSLEPRQESLQIPTVSAGESDQLMAEPHSKHEQNSVREQVRFWLRLDDSSTSSPQLADSSVTCGPQGADNPWLQYNWRGVGDEDPSAVVTFGVHRGNDRVIFRGEARLTGQ
ncbi:DUF6701 domain-containing protein [Vibrio sp. CDRSL-10 TSBA]